MSYTSWLPGRLKDLLQHVPTLLFEVVPWSALWKEAGVLSRRLLSGEGAEAARHELSAYLPAGVRLSDSPVGTPHKAQERQLLGERILVVYFAQMRHPGPVFLDLRLTGFGLQGDELAWDPGRLWGRFSDPFRQGLTLLYRGFYQHDEALLQEGLLRTGLVRSDWTPAERERMAQLMKENFGASIQGPMRFELQAFQRSFQKVFQLLLEKKVQLSTDFVLLGIMLVTLYSALEELGGEFHVARAYQEAQQVAA